MARLRARRPYSVTAPGNRIVKASVQDAKIIGTDRSLPLHGKFGDGLADVAVVVDDRDRVNP
jgi:hypothetical protein